MATSEECHRQLIDACNLICEHVSENLPSGWELLLSMCADEAELTLLNPDGDRVELRAAEWRRSLIDDACEEARELSDTNSAIAMDYWSR